MIDGESPVRGRSVHAGPRVAVALAALLVAGCASIFTGTTDRVAFDANVPGVRLAIDGQFRGELPLTVEMSRDFVGGQEFVARFERAGYVPQEFRLTRDFNVVSLLDISSPITSGGVDLLTGSLMKFSPREYHVQMLAIGQSATSSAFRRGADRVRFALTNAPELQREIARGGGERLSTFAAMVGGDAATARAVEVAVLRDARDLVAAPTAPAFVARVDRLLAADASLAACRL